MVDLKSSLSINGWSFYSIFQQFELKKNPTAAAHGGKEYIPLWAARYLSGTLTPGARRLTPRATATGS
jgi:hypothetical protein